MYNIIHLYNRLDLNIDSIGSDIKADYLTENYGRDGQSYWYYMDTTKEAAINRETGEIITDLTELGHLFGLR